MDVINHLLWDIADLILLLFVFEYFNLQYESVPLSLLLTQLEYISFYDFY